MTAKYSPLREDLERNDGSLERPYYMSKSLKQILGKMEKTASEQARFRPGSYAHYCDAYYCNMDNMTSNVIEMENFKDLEDLIPQVQ